MRILSRWWARWASRPHPEPPDVFTLLNHTWVAQAIYVVVRLGVVDHLAAGPKTVPELAQLTGANESQLAQIMRALESFGGFVSDAEGRYANTPFSEPLAASHDSWLRPYALAYGRQLYAATGAMYEMITTGRDAWEIAHGKPIYEFYRSDAEEGQIFVDFMNATTNWQRSAIVAAFDFTPYQHVVDVGGNRASLITSILLANPHLQGTIFDQPHMEPSATETIREAGLSERCRFVGGSFMQAVPGGGDLYTIKHVLHDWPDADAAQIVASIASAMSADATLMIIEGLMDDRADQGQLIKMRDLEQMISTGGKVRSEAEFEALLRSAGLRLERVEYTAVLDCCMILARKPRP